MAQNSRSQNSNTKNIKIKKIFQAKYNKILKNIHKL